MRAPLGVVEHFSIAVKDPKRSARFGSQNFDLDEIFRFNDGIAVSNAAITIALSRALETSPNIGLWFHDPDGYRWELSVRR